MLEDCELLKVGLFLGTFHHPILKREDRGEPFQYTLHKRVRGGDERGGMGMLPSLKT